MAKNHDCDFKIRLVYAIQHRIIIEITCGLKTEVQ